jgi:chromosome partitioning protein
MIPPDRARCSKNQYYVNWRNENRSTLGDIRKMLITPRQGNLNKIVILNPKGGCGKSTLATNLAACFANRGTAPAVMDYDRQGSTMGWLERRPADLPEIHGIAAYKKSMQATRSWQLRVPVETETLLIDSPAGIDHDDLRELTRDSTSILVPVLPSTMDIHAVSRCIADLLLVAKIDRRDRKMAVIGNRTRKNTKSLSILMRFLDSLGIPIIAVLRDTQNFVHSAEKGIGICEMTPSLVRPDVEQLNKIVAWLDDWPQRRRKSTSATAFNRTTTTARPVDRNPQFSSV